MRSSKQYFMTYDAEDLASELDTYHKKYMSSGMNPVYRMWLRNTYAYYSTILDAETWITSLAFAGEQGELVKMSIPQARGLIRQLVTLVTKQKLAFNAIAEKAGVDVTEEKRIANALAVQTVDKQRLDLLVEYLVEKALVVGTSFIATRWRSDWGTPRAVNQVEGGGEQVIYDGDLEVSVHDVQDLTYDFTVERWEDLNWAEVRVKRNRWDLAAQHPELEKEILALPSISQEVSSKASFDYDNVDMVYAYELYHKPTPSLPRGRFMAYSDKKTIYHDDVNKMGKIPIEQYKPETITGIGFGYPMLSSLLPAQEMLDHSYSCLATNQSALGVQNITVARNAGINVQQINGLNFFEYSPQDATGGGRPETLDLLKSAPELFKLPETMLSSMQQLSFINAAVRGDLPAGTSGVAIATLTTNALEFLNSYTKNLQVVLQNTMMNVISTYQKYATVERVVSIAGKNNQTYAKKFIGSQLAPITGFKMDSVNPLMQTIAGRLDIAEKTMQQGLVRDLQSYVSILDGQPLNTLYAPESSENDLIASENERLEEGRQVTALSVDKHPLHMMRHKTLLNDPDIRDDAPRVAVIQAHIEDHLMLEKTTDPMLMTMCATGMAPQMQPGQQPAPPVGGGGPPPDGGAAESMQTELGLESENAMPETETAQDLLGRM